MLLYAEIAQARAVSLYRPVCSKESLRGTPCTLRELARFFPVNSNLSVRFARFFRGKGVPERYCDYCSSDFDRMFCNTLSNRDLCDKPNGGPDIAPQTKVDQRVELRANNL